MSSLRWITALLATTSALLGCAGTAAAGGPVPSPVQRTGAWITDDEGRVVIPHGVDIVQKTAPYFPNYFTPSDAEFLANLGFTAARIGFIWAGVEPKPGQYDNKNIDEIVHLNEVLARYGIRTLIDFHQDFWSQAAGGDGAPDWANIGGYFLDDFQRFWNNEPASDGVGIQTHFVNTWKHVVPMVDASPAADNVIGWDPLNEPLPGTDSACSPYDAPCPAFEQGTENLNVNGTQLAGTLPAFYDSVIAGIRGTGDHHVIFPEDIAQDGDGQPLMPGFSDAQTAFTFHYYCDITESKTEELPAGADAVCQPKDQFSITNYLDYLKSLNVPGFLGEFGNSDADDETTTMVDLFDQHFLPWTYWAYCFCNDPFGSSGQGILIHDDQPASMANAKLPKLQALVVPYAQAIAGTPGNEAYDRSTDTLTLSYTASPVAGATLAPHAVTRIFVPQLKYPHGYHVAVTGGTVVSGPMAPWVEVRAAQPGAGVSVTITPATNSSTQTPAQTGAFPRVAS